MGRNPVGNTRLIRLSLYVTLGFGLLALPACSKDDDNGKGAQRTATLRRVTSLQNETLGGFAVGTETEELREALGEPVEMKVDQEEDAATGCFHTEWLYPDRGLSFGVCGDRQGEGSVRWITASAPSTAKTSAGIGVGSSAADMKTVYGALQMMDEDAWISVSAEVEAGVVKTITLSEMPE